MKWALGLLIVACLGYLVLGRVAVSWHWMTDAQYQGSAVIVGGIASVLGLLSLLRRRLTQADVQQVEVETLKQLVATSEELGRLEATRATTRQELGDLESRKQEMELLVRKASLTLFLRDQRDRCTADIQEALVVNPHLVEALDLLASTDEKLHAPNEEIAGDRNVELLTEVLRDARHPASRAEVLARALPFPFGEIAELFLPPAGSPLRRLLRRSSRTRP